MSIEDKGLSIHILIAAYDSPGSDVAGRSADKFKAFVRTQNPQSTTALIGSKLTRKAFKSKYAAALTNLAEPNTRVVVCMVGHGSQFADHDGDESDGWDEGFLTANGVLKDDELTDMLNRVAVHSTSLLILVSDHCSSGTMLDKQRSRPGKNWVNIASSQPKEDSFEVREGTAMLCSLLKYLRAFPGVTVGQLLRGFPAHMRDDMKQMADPVLQWIPDEQHPCISLSSDSVRSMPLLHHPSTQQALCNQRASRHHLISSSSKRGPAG